MDQFKSGMHDVSASTSVSDDVSHFFTYQYPSDKFIAVDMNMVVMN